jgi:hypothetical protein
VHGCRDGDESRPEHLRSIEWFDREVESRRSIPGTFEKRERHGEALRLVPELIARDEEDGSRFAEVVGGTLRHRRELQRSRSPAHPVALSRSPSIRATSEDSILTSA